MTIQFFWCHFLYGCTFFVKPSQSSEKVEAKVSKVFRKVLLELPRPRINCNILSKPYIVSTGIAEWLQVAFGNFLMQQFCQDEEKKWELVTDDNIIEMFANDIKSLIEEKDDTMKMQQNSE